MSLVVSYFKVPVSLPKVSSHSNEDSHRDVSPKNGPELFVGDTLLLVLHDPRTGRKCLSSPPQNSPGDWVGVTTGMDPQSPMDDGKWSTNKVYVQDQGTTRSPIRF